MKQIMIIFILSMLSCKTTESAMQESKSDVLVYYSKGRCLGKCPVYEVFIHTDGTLIYNPIANAGKNGKVQTTLTSAQIEVLMKALSRVNFETIEFKRIRDLPITRLKYESKEVKYYVSKVNGDLKEVNVIIENLIKSIS